MGSLRKRNGKWNAQVRIAGWRSFSKTFSKKTDAEDWCKVTEAKIQSLPVPEISQKHLCLKDLFDRYLNEIEHLKSKHILRYKLGMISRSWLGGIKIDLLSNHHINQFTKDRLRIVKEGTVRSEVMLIKHILKLAYDHWGMSFICDPIRGLVIPKTHKPRKRRISKEEFDAIMKSALSQKNKYIPFIIEFARETGMRRSEILKLKWTDCKNGLACLKDTKNGDERTIPLTKKAKSTLDNMERKHLNVFPISTQCLKSAWRRVVDKSKVNDLRFHDLRHEAISSFFEKGLSAPEVALISGHKDLRQLFQYTHLKPEVLSIKFKNIFNSN